MQPESCRRRTPSATRATSPQSACSTATFTAATAWADSSFGGGSGTLQDPYLIGTPQHLRQLAADVNDDGEVNIADVNTVVDVIQR